MSYRGLKVILESKITILNKWLLESQNERLKPVLK